MCWFCLFRVRRISISSEIDYKVRKPLRINQNKTSENAGKNKSFPKQNLNSLFISTLTFLAYSKSFPKSFFSIILLTFLSVNFRSVGQPVVRPRPSFRPVHPRMDFQEGGKQENSPHSRPLSRTHVYIIMCGSLTSAGRAAAYFPTCGKRRRSVPRETFPHVGKRNRYMCLGHQQPRVYFP